MNFYAATLGELLIIEAFVFYIWLRVLIDTIKANERGPLAMKLILTSIGLVVSSGAIFGIIATRSIELYFNGKYIVAVSSFYVALGIGGFLFMISAALYRSWRQIALFLVVSAGWTGYYSFNSVF